jgi:hypothetical protein
VSRHADELAVTLEAAPEPHLSWLGALSVHIDRAVDDAGQQLERAWTPVDTSPAIQNAAILMRNRYPAATTATPQSLGVLFKKGEKPSRLLKELSGSVLAQVQTEAEPIITVDKVLQAAGQTFRGGEGGSIKVIEAGKMTNGLAMLRVQLEVPPEMTVAAMPARPRVLPAGARGAAGLPLQGGINGLHLFDDKGNAVQMFQMRAQAMATPGGLLWDYTLAYQPAAGVGEPAKLVLAGCRTVTINIPFRLTDVPLP